MGLTQTSKKSSGKTAELGGREEKIFLSVKDTAMFLEVVADAAFIARIRERAFKHKRYGYRRIWTLLRREGAQISLRRMKRLWKQEKLKVKKKQKRKRRPGVVTLIPERAQSPNHVWTVDFVHDRLSRAGMRRIPASPCGR